jgi:hypothetical protein
LLPQGSGDDFDRSDGVTVPRFRLFYFRASRLERTETIEAPDPLTAVHEAAGRPSGDVVELWSDEGKIATFRPTSRHGFE